MSIDDIQIAGVVVADATRDGCPLTYVSPGFEQLTGYTADEALGRKCSFLQGPDTDPRAVEVLSSAIAAGREAYVTVLNYRADGTPFWNEVALAPQRDGNGRVVSYLGVQKDVTGRRRADARIHELAYFDSLTGLANRAMLQDELAQALTTAQAETTQLALLFLDVDDFKRINDQFGHAVGDDLLRDVAGRLRSVVREQDLLARPGGDEFLLLVRRREQVTATATDLAARVIGCMREPFEIPGSVSVQVRASVGVSTYPRDADTIEDLMRHADAAMYMAKTAGKDGFHMYRRQTTPTGHTDLQNVDLHAHGDELDRILAGGSVTAVFQPIVEIDVGTVVGYEALTRGPEGSPLQRPDLLFAAAAAAGRTEELDWLCRLTAVRDALEAGLGTSAALFLNCEPSVIGSQCPPAHAGLWQRAVTELDLVLEITERAVTDRPAELSREVAGHRTAGRAIALDDLGADVRSLALLPFVEPEVIKLDLRLVQDRPSTDQAAIVSAVAAERERTGAAILAEGIETTEHVMIARTLGATLGQGWLWGRPGPLPATPPQASRPWARRRREAEEPSGRTPFEVIAACRPTADATKRLLLPMSHHLENRALRIGEGAVVLSAFQHSRHFTPATARRYEMLVRGASLVAALGVGLDDAPVPGVRGAQIGPGDPLAGEWSVIVIGPHFTGALVAQDLGDDGRDSDRRFVFATAYERGLVIAAARTLLSRIAPVRASQLQALV